jgi:hypothetical protein
MEPFSMGMLVIMGIVGVLGFFLFSVFSGKTTMLKAVGIGGGSGAVFGGFATVITNTHQFITACYTGNLGIYGWLCLIGLGLFVLVLVINGITSVSQNKPVRLVK